MRTSSSYTASQEPAWLSYAELVQSPTNISPCCLQVKKVTREVKGERRKAHRTREEEKRFALILLKD